MEIEQDLNLFGFSINNPQPRRDQHPPPPPPPPLQEQDSQLPSTTLSLFIHPSVPPAAPETPHNIATFKPVGVVDIDNIIPIETPMPKITKPRVLHAPKPHTKPSTTLSLSIHQPRKIIKKPRLPVPQSGIKIFGVILGKPQNPEPKKIIRPPNPKLHAPDPQHLPPRYRDFLIDNGLVGANDPIKLVLTRVLYPTDVNPNHGRLSMPCKQVKADFLSPGEEELIHQSEQQGSQKRTLRKKIDVTVVDPSCKIRRMKFTKWNDSIDAETGKQKSWLYALLDDWKEVGKDNKLAVGVAIQVWSFRMIQGGGLGFVIHKMDQPGEAKDNADIAISDGEGSSVIN